MSQLKKGAILNYITIILTNVVGLVLTPFIISKLGDAEFGLYTLIGALVGYISVLDFGLHHTIVRFVAKYKAEKDKKAEENFLAITMLIYLFISCIVILIGVVCYFSLEKIFESSLERDQLDKAKIMFVILIFNLAITLPGGSFKGICSGYEQFVFPKSVDITRYIVRSLMLVAVLLLGGQAISIVILDTAMNILVILANAIFVLRKLKVKFKLHDFQMHLVKEIFSYSIWIFVFIIIAQFQWRAGQMALGVITNTTVVAIFAVGVMLGTYYGAFSTAISGVFLPKATQMTVAKASSKELTDMMIRIGRLSFIILLYILGAFIMFGKQFVILWVGESYIDAWTIATIIMVAYTFPLIQSFANSVLEARSKLSFKAILYLISIVIGTAIGALLAREYGGIGMISGTVFGWLGGQIIMNFYYHKVVKINIIRFFKEIFSKTMITLFGVLFTGYFINLIPGNDWLNFVLKSVLYTIVYFFSMFYFGMIPFEKEMLKGFIQKITNFLKIKLT